MGGGEGGGARSRLLETGNNSFQLSFIVTKNSILDLGRGPGLVK